MPAEEQVTIIIVGRDQASKIFGTIGKQADKAGQTVKNTLGKELKAAGKSMTDVGKKMSVGLTVPLAAFAGMAVNTAVKAERLQKTLTGLAGGADEAAKYISAIKEASRGTIPQVEALAIANRSLSFGIVENADEMAKLTEVAIALGRAQGLDATRAVSDLSTALSRQSPMILDNLGITMKLSESYSIYAAKLGKSVDALTAEEKSLAFRNAALEKGMEVVERMGGVQDDMASSSERLKAQVSDLSLEVGNALIPVMQQGIDIIGPVIKSFTELDDGTKKLIISLGMGVAAAGPLMTIFGKLTSVVGGLVDGVSAAGGGLKGLSAVMKSGQLSALLLAGGIAVAVAAYQNLQEQIKETKQKQEDLLTSLQKFDMQGAEGADVAREFARRMKLVADETAGVKDVILWLGANSALVDTASRADLLAGAEKGLHEAAVATSKTYKDYLKIIDEYNARTSDATLKTEALSKIQYMATTRTGDWVQELAAALQAYDAQEQALAKNSTRMDEAKQLLRDVENDTMRAVNAEIEYTKTLERGREARKRMSEQQRIMGEEEAAWGPSAEMIRENQAKAEAYTTRISELAAEQAAATEGAELRRRAAWEESQRVQAGLISQMQDATLEQFKQQLLAQVDPAVLGTAAWARYGQELGLIDDEAVKAALGIDAITSAIEGKILPIENAAEAVAKIYDATKDGNESLPDYRDNIANIIDEFAEAPGLIGDSAAALELTNERLARLGEELAEPATTKMGDFDDVMSNLPSSLAPVKEGLDGIEEKLIGIAKDWTVTVKIKTEGSVPSGPGYPNFQHGGIVPGPVGAPRLIIAHGGEHFMGAPSAQTNNQTSNFNQTNNIYNPLAAAIIANQNRRQRYDRLNARM